MSNSTETINVRCNCDRSQVRWSAGCHAVGAEGLQGLAMDKSTFPSEIAHGHFIHRQGPRLLARWGLLNKIVGSNCPPVLTQTTDYGDFPLTGKVLHLATLLGEVCSTRSWLTLLLMQVQS